MAFQKHLVFAGFALGTRGCPRSSDPSSEPGTLAQRPGQLSSASFSPCRSQSKPGFSEPRDVPQTQSLPQRNSTVRPEKGPPGTPSPIAASASASISRPQQKATPAVKLTGEWPLASPVISAGRKRKSRDSGRYREATELRTARN